MLSMLQHIADTNKYFQKELEHKDEIIRELKAQRAFLQETVFVNPEGFEYDELLDRVMDIPAESASIYDARVE